MPISLHTEAYQCFVDLLVRARKQAGLSQAELATRLGRPQSFVSKCERGERRVDVVEFVLIADALGVDAGAFIQDYRAEAARLAPAECG